MSTIKSEVGKIRRRLSRLADELGDIEQVIADNTTATESDSDKDVVNLTEMADLLGVSLATIRRYIKQGKLTPYRLGSKQYFLRSELPQILKEATESTRK